MKRRDFLEIVGAAPLALAAACQSTTEGGEPEPARLALQARSRTRGTLTGTDVLTDANLRRAYIRVPPSYSPDVPAPLIIGLHGAGGRGDTFTGAFASRTDALGAVMLAPDSLGGTWDAVTDEFGPDVSFINDVVDQAFRRCNIDANKIFLLGFSDGATYAISLGIANGDQVAGVVAFSPGYYVVDHPHGTPSYFVSHGTLDGVLAIENASRKIVPELRARGSTVNYVEFEGGHSVPDAIADQAMAWINLRA